MGHFQEEGLAESRQGVVEEDGYWAVMGLEVVLERGVWWQG